MRREGSQAAPASLLRQEQPEWRASLALWPVAQSTREKLACDTREQDVLTDVTAAEAAQLCNLWKLVQLYT